MENSAYAARWLNAQPQWVDLLTDLEGQPVDGSVIDRVLSSSALLINAPVVDLTVLGAQLRLARQQLMLLLALKDLNHEAPVAEVTQAMTLFAEKVIAIGLEALRKDMRELVGEPLDVSGQYLPLMVVGMGKLGGRELNVSSDIDLVFLYEEDGDTQGGIKSISNHEWYGRIGKKLIALLSELRPEGFVFRVDMRLRPNGDSGPLVCSLAMLEEYFSVQGREWERYAWIKGRMVSPIETDPIYARFQKACRI